MLYVGAYDVSRRYGGATQLQALTNQMLVTHRHKISLIDDNMNIGWSQTAPAAQWIPFLNGSAFASANGYAGPGVLTSNNVYSIGTYGIMTAGITQNAFTAMLNAWETWFARNSPLTERFIYLCDEVACQNSTPSLTTQLGWWSAITGAGRNLHTLATQPLLNVAQTALSNPTSGWPYSQGMYPARTNGYTSVDQSAANSVKSKEPCLLTAVRAPVKGRLPPRIRGLLRENCHGPNTRRTSTAGSSGTRTTTPTIRADWETPMSSRQRGHSASPVRIQAME